jgi:hypothetical protein
MIPESKCLNALLRQEFFTRFIPLHSYRQAMLKSIQFDDQFGVRAIKIQNVPADYVLPAKFETGKMPSAQSTPQFFFLVRLIVPKLAGDLFQAHGGRIVDCQKNFMPLTPALSPFGGEREKGRLVVITILPIPPAVISQWAQSSSR